MGLEGSGEEQRDGFEELLLIELDEELLLEPEEELLLELEEDLLLELEEDLLLELEELLEPDGEELLLELEEGLPLDSASCMRLDTDLVRGLKRREWCIQARCSAEAMAATSPPGGTGSVDASAGFLFPTPRLVSPLDRNDVLRFAILALHVAIPTVLGKSFLTVFFSVL